MTKHILITSRKLASSALIILISLSSLPLTAQSFSGSKVVNPANGMTISVTAYPIGDSVQVTMTGPTNVWFSFGFGRSFMTNTYCIVTDGTGNITERKLGNHNSGSLLSPSLSKSSYSSSGGIGTTKVTRTLMGSNSNYFTFPGTASTVTLIWASGNSSSLGSHSNRGATTLVLSKNCKNAVDVSITQNGSQLSANKSGAAYRWLDCTNGNGVISGETSQSFVPNMNGSYAAEITEGGCTDTSACFSINNIGIGEMDFTDKISTYPSPTTGNVSLSLGDHHPEVTATIYTHTGKVVLLEEYTDTEEIRFNLKGPKGLYFVHITTTTGKTATTKIFKI